MWDKNSKKRKQLDFQGGKPSMLYCSDACFFIKYFIGRKFCGINFHRCKR